MAYRGRVVVSCMDGYKAFDDPELLLAHIMASDPLGLVRVISRKEGKTVTYPVMAQLSKAVVLYDPVNDSHVTVNTQDMLDEFTGYNGKVLGEKL